MTYAGAQQMSSRAVVVQPMCPVLGCGILPSRPGGHLRFRTSRDPPRRFMMLAALSAAGIAVCAAAVAVTLSGHQSSNPALDAEIRAAIIAAPIAVGLFVWYRD